MSNYYGVQRSEEYLAHYGVLGMKWGMRRAAKKGTEYQYKSHATKKYQKLAEKLAKKGKTEKAAKMANRAKRSAEIDRGEQEYAKNLSTSKAILGALTVGTDTMKGYAQHRAMSKQTGKEVTGHKVMAGITAFRSGSIGSRFRKAGYIKQDEKGNGPIKSLHKLDEEIHNRGAAGIDRAKKMSNAVYKNTTGESLSRRRKSSYRG